MGALPGLMTLGASSQLPFARTQMAITLGVHIILVPLGVAWPAITLIADYRAIRKGDADSLRLAQRWSKVMAVTFAVGAVTGTVLSFELGLLWPRLMDRFGAAFGIPFAIEGIFFFTEAIFIAIYIYGWKRLRPWPHFWTGVPIMIAGIGGAVSVVAANSWMNQPGGFTLDKAGKVVDVDPLAVIFNRATPYESLHMIIAAYLVGGFLVASVYAVGILKGRTDRYHRIGFLIPFTVAAIAAPAQMVVGDWAARSVYHDQPVKFAAIEAVPRTSTHVPETLGGIYADGKVTGGIEIPDVASLLSGYSVNTRIKGFETVPARDRPPVTPVHLAWDVMVGLGTALTALSLWFAVVWWRRRRMPNTRWFLRAAALSGAAAIAALESGWVVTEVGRQPWIVSGFLRTEDAVTTVGDLWISLVVVLVLYAALAATAILVLRSMAARWRRAATEGELEEESVPYGPRPEMHEVGR
ncbi:MAG TPA: cytochrome ubiquinol oxidase subunit I [Acidimicrobiia bacterium]|nr:cytochrome ubiquinol oxidase subunit I [Acidimicrobiia bacterium]